LVELILAMILLSVVIMTGLSMEMGLRRLFHTSDQEAELMGEAGAILTFVSRKVQSSFGNQALLPNPITSVTQGGQYVRYRIRQDLNHNGRWDPPFDDWDEFTYCINWGGLRNQLLYGRNNLTIMVLSDNVVAFGISNVTADGCSLISVTLRNDPTSAANATNPQLSLNTTAQVRGLSLR